MHVIIAEDHILFREAIAKLIKEIEPQATIDEVSRYEEVYQLLKDRQGYDLIIVDLDLPDIEWEQGLFQIKERSKEAKIIVITASEDIPSIKKAVSMGILGYIPKSLPPKVMLGAIKIVMEGGSYLPITALNQIKRDSVEEEVEANKRTIKNNLTGRQLEVLRLIAQGKSNKQIAYEMQVSEATVKLHINSLLKNLQVHNRTQAVLEGQKQGIL